MYPNSSNVITGTSTMSLRPTGIGRYFTAAFLSVWLVGWAVGEVFALGMLGTIASALSGIFSDRLPAWSSDFVASGGVAFAILFLLLWLTLWTIGGIAALTHVTRSLVGEDVIGLNESGFEVVRRVGPFRRRYVFDRSSIRRLRIRPNDKALVVDTARGVRVITTFGPPGDRDSVAGWLDRHLALPDSDAGAPPRTWELLTELDAAYLRKVTRGGRRVRSFIAWLLTAAIAYAWFRSFEAQASTGGVPAFVLVLLLAAGAALSTWGRREWIIRPGELTFHRSFAMWTSERTFRSARLEVTHSTDSDNDSHYKLIVTDADGCKTVHSQLHDSGEVIDLAQWLARHTGFTLTSAEQLSTFRGRSTVVR